MQRVSTVLLERGSMGISRFNQAIADDVLGIASFGKTVWRLRSGQPHRHGRHLYRHEIHRLPPSGACARGRYCAA